MLYFHALSNGNDSISFPHVLFSLFKYQKCRKFIEMNNPRKKITKIHKSKNKTNENTPVYIVFIYITMLNIEAQYAPVQQVYKAA